MSNFNYDLKISARTFKWIRRQTFAKFTIFSPDQLLAVPKEFRGLVNPYIYGWFRDNQYLYIGSSRTGFRRFRQKRVIGVFSKIDNHDEFHFIFCDSPNLTRMEADLITLIQPTYNRNASSFDSYQRTQIEKRYLNNKVLGMQFSSLVL